MSSRVEKPKSKTEEIRNEISIKYEIDGNEIKLTPKIVKDYIVGTGADITLQEFKLFAELCKVHKLNPYLKEVYCIKYGNEPATIVVGKDAVLKRAIKNSNFDGIESGIIVLNESNEVIERNGTFKLVDEELVGGWAKVYRKDWVHPTYCSVSFDEVAGRKKDGTLNSNWANKGATMVEKVAKVRALRESFVDDLQGMYEVEEFAPEITSYDEVKPSVQEVPEADYIEAEEVNLNEL